MMIKGQMVLGRLGGGVEKWERVAIGRKGKSEIRNEVVKFTGMVADVPTKDSLKKMEHLVDGGMAAQKVEVLLVINGLDVDRTAEA